MCFQNYNLLHFLFLQAIHLQLLGYHLQRGEIYAMFFYITIQKVTVNFGILISTYLSSYLIQQVNKLCLLFLQMQLRVQKSANIWKIIEILSNP